MLESEFKDLKGFSHYPFYTEFLILLCDLSNVVVNRILLFFSNFHQWIMKKYNRNNVNKINLKNCSRFFFSFFFEQALVPTIDNSLFKAHFSTLRCLMEEILCKLKFYKQANEQILTGELTGNSRIKNRRLGAYLASNTTTGGLNGTVAGTNTGTSTAAGTA